MYFADYGLGWTYLAIWCLTKTWLTYSLACTSAYTLNPDIETEQECV